MWSVSYTNPSNFSYSIEFSMCVLCCFFFSFLVLECVLGFVIFGLCKWRSKAYSWVKCIYIFFLVFCVLEKVRVIVYNMYWQHWYLESSDWSLLFSHCYFFFPFRRHGLIKPRCEGLRSFVAFCGVILFLFKKTWILEGSWCWVFKVWSLVAKLDKQHSRGDETPNERWQSSPTTHEFKRKL